jgi:hypothetical protein
MPQFVLQTSMIVLINFLKSKSVGTFTEKKIRKTGRIFVYTLILSTFFKTEKQLK